MAGVDEYWDLAAVVSRWTGTAFGSTGRALGGSQLQRDRRYVPATKPRAWTEVRLRVPNLGLYDIAPDGKQLAAMIADEDADKLPTSLGFLVNFGDEQRRKAPAEK